MNDLIHILNELLKRPAERKALIAQFEDALDHFTSRNKLESEALDILSGLQLDFAYYVPDVHARAEDPSYFDDQELVRRIEEALVRLEGLRSRGERI